eukprot:CAMPEP_0118949904 /NCGR_PEP_ID=MMETSP1169-20130426/50447_1 /TAXON_ID=36882 /ORGANISM="Pyramimonas obovata, Strain CCMP722" /LENGTH=33 /DNA_ID= /DNA_START= /DNA_END= /DNA_ORIENTATION=
MRRCPPPGSQLAATAACPARHRMDPPFLATEAG